MPKLSDFRIEYDHPIYIKAFNNNGMVIYPVIHLRTGHPHRTLKHEMVHVHEICQQGVIKWYLKYLFNWFRYGYSNHPAEERAREVQYDLLTTDEANFYKRHGVL